MFRDRDDEIDETEEVSLEETQEYDVAGEAETREERTGDFETDEFEDDGEFRYDDGDESGFVDEPEFERDEPDFEDDFIEEDALQEPFDDETGIVDRETEEAELPGAVRPGEESISGHLKAAGAALVARLRQVRPPRVPKPNLPKSGGGPVVGVLAIAAAALAVGLVAFFLGKGTGDDVDTARLEGAAAGRQAGAIEGASAGYAKGFQKGRDAGFRKTYEDAYKLNFKRAFEQAGLDPPTGDEIDVPEP